jgi:hypothetical protein
MNSQHGALRYDKISEVGHVSKLSTGYNSRIFLRNWKKHINSYTITRLYNDHLLSFLLSQILAQHAMALYIFFNYVLKTETCGLFYSQACTNKTSVPICTVYAPAKYNLCYFFAIDTKIQVIGNAQSSVHSLFNFPQYCSDHNNTRT